MYVARSSYKISGVEGISKHELLPDHDSHLVTQVVKPVWLVETSSPNKFSRYSCRECSHCILTYQIRIML